MTALALRSPFRSFTRSASSTHAPSSPPLGVTAKGIVKRFDDRGDVLKNIDLDFKPGEFIAVVGRSGCGKSTLLRLLAGLDQPTAGDLGTAGHDGDPHVGDPRVRIMFQDARLLPWKRVIDNVGLGQKGDWRPSALDALRQVGLEARANDWPGVLSGGQRQRVALARALVSRPGLLLLDEPLGALDALTRIEMQSLVEDVWRRQGFTAVLVTHDVAEAVTLADRVILLEEGRVALDQRIDLPRSRDRSHPDFAALEGAILHRLLRNSGA
jgi:sulfonate transport system ATP-binding protein